MGAIPPLGHPTAPRAADGRSEARAGTSLLRDLLNGLEMVELLAGPASGMHGKHGDGTGMLISALRPVISEQMALLSRNGRAYT